jgi:hypothetical protein
MLALWSALIQSSSGKGYLPDGPTLASGAPPGIGVNACPKEDLLEYKADTC